MTATRAVSALPAKVRDVQHKVREAGISTCTISDALDGLGMPNGVLNSRVRRLSGGTEIVVGTALPVRWVQVRKGQNITADAASTWSQVRDFVLPDVVDGRGLMYVAGAGELITSAALAGGLSLSYLCGELGFVGLVLGGAIRDQAVVENSEFPVAATNFVPTDTQGAFRVHSVGESCLIKDVLVQQGDWVFSDGNGSVVVPAARLTETLSRAAEIERAEQQVVQRLREGGRLAAVIDELGHI